MLKKICAILVTFLLLLLSSEAYLTFKGYALPDPNNLEAAHFDDQECGWLPVPGRSYSREDQQAETTVDHNFCRLSCPPKQAAHLTKQRQEALLLGCSYTFGMGVKDTETFGWILNQRQQRFYFTNGGVIGYSTYQCQKRLEKFFRQGAKPRLVVYAFINDHLMRNVSCRIFGKKAESFDFIETPYFEVKSSGETVFHPLRHLAWPGETYLRTVNFANRLYVNYLTEQTRRVRFNQEASHQIYRRLIGQMADLCCQNGAIFVVANLDTSSNWLFPALSSISTASNSAAVSSTPNLTDVSTFTATDNNPTATPILYLDANCEDLYKPEYHVKNRLDFHPAPIAHKFWAKKITDFVQNIKIP